jgi:hypothetical protein
VQGATMRRVHKESIAQFQNKLFNEKWGNIYQSNDVNETFNLFLNAYLLAYESCFFKQNVTHKNNNNGWITMGIRTSCRCKESLYILSRNNNNYLFKLYYGFYCMILRRVITEATRKYYNRIITSAEEKIKTTWNITDIETGRKSNNNIVYQKPSKIILKNKYR